MVLTPAPPVCLHVVDRHNLTAPFIALSRQLMVTSYNLLLLHTAAATTLTDNRNYSLLGPNTTQFRRHVTLENPATFIFRTDENVHCISYSDNPV
jgi:hypothetical protein